MIIFFNGKFVKEEEAVVPVTTHALHYGTGCYEGIRAYYNASSKSLFAFRIEDHYKRMLNSAKILFIDIPYSLDELVSKTVELVQKNFAETDLYIRPLAFKSDPAIGNFNLKKVASSFVIYTVPLGRHFPADKTLKVGISSWRRVSDNAIPARAKATGSYINTCLVKTESALLGFDEGLFLDQDGHVVEASAENIFMVKNGVVYTPPVSADILAGITRDTVILLCKNELNLEVIERNIDRTEIYTADEVFLSGTGAEISSVSEIDHRTIGQGNQGEIFLKVRELYQKIVHGEESKYSNFLTEIKQT